MPVCDLRQLQILAQRISDPLRPFTHIVPDAGIGLTFFIAVLGKKPDVSIQSGCRLALPGTPCGFAVWRTVDSSCSFFTDLQQFSGLIHIIDIPAARHKTQALQTAVKLCLHQVHGLDFSDGMWQQLNIENGQTYLCPP